MSRDESRRFTDREVALVLRRATEIDEAEERETPGAEGGLTLADLEEIGRQVGISREAIERAVSRVERGAATPSVLSGPPRARRAVRAVAGELTEEGLARLVRLVDEETDAAGVTSEAVGSVQWTSRDRFSSLQVSLTPEGGETRIRVVDKAASRFVRILHLVPAAWGAILTPAVLQNLDVGATGMVAVLVGGVALGGVAGRAVWTYLSARSGREVERLAARLAEEGRRAADAGLVKKRSDKPDAEE